jgi:Frag1/DRAM/Sfk1 family
VFSYLAISGSAIGGAGLIFLSIFDTKRFPTAHRAFLLVFIVGVALSAIFTIIEVCFKRHSPCQMRILMPGY